MLPNLIARTFYVKNGEHQHILQYLLGSILADGSESCALSDRGCVITSYAPSTTFYLLHCLSSAALQLLSNLCYLCMHASEISIVKYYRK